MTTAQRSELVINWDKMAGGTYQCSDCHMTFNTPLLLQKHKAKFCVGASLGDPDDLTLRHGLRGSVSPPRGGGMLDDDRDEGGRRYNPNQDSHIRQLAENHGRQMEYLQLRNKDLEKQREDIRKQLENLGKKTLGDRDSTTQLLQDLKAQEERNQRALQDLKYQLSSLNTNRVNVIEREVEKPVYHPPPAAPPPPPPPEPPKRSLAYPIYYGNSLVQEISAIRQAYLQNGGNDPDILAQMAQMLAEAQAIEDQLKRSQDVKPRTQREKKDYSSQVSMLEMENERLHRELLLLQEQNTLARDRRKTDKEDELERDLKRLQKEHLQKLYDLQREIALLREQALMDRLRPPPTQAAPQPQPQPPVSLRPYVEVEPMAPYDQYPNRYVPAMPASSHHSWNTTQYYRPHPIPAPRPDTPLGDDAVSQVPDDTGTEL